MIPNSNKQSKVAIDSQGNIIGLNTATASILLPEEVAIADIYNYKVIDGKFIRNPEQAIEVESTSPLTTTIGEFLLPYFGSQQ